MHCPTGICADWVAKVGEEKTATRLSVLHAWLHGMFIEFLWGVPLHTQGVLGLRQIFWCLDDALPPGELVQAPVLPKLFWVQYLMHAVFCAFMQLVGKGSPPCWTHCVSDVESP